MIAAKARLRRARAERDNLSAQIDAARLELLHIRVQAIEKKAEIRILKEERHEVQSKVRKEGETFSSVLSEENIDVTDHKYAYLSRICTDLSEVYNSEDEEDEGLEGREAGTALSGSDETENSNSESDSQW